MGGVRSRPFFKTLQPMKQALKLVSKEVTSSLTTVLLKQAYALPECGPLLVFARLRVITDKYSCCKFRFVSRNQGKHVLKGKHVLSIQLLYTVTTMVNVCLYSTECVSNCKFSFCLIAETGPCSCEH